MSHKLRCQICAMSDRGLSGCGVLGSLGIGVSGLEWVFARAVEMFSETQPAFIGHDTLHSADLPVPVLRALPLTIRCLIVWCVWGSFWGLARARTNSTTYPRFLILSLPALRV
jgi:hypothetical protein